MYIPTNAAYMYASGSGYLYAPFSYIPNRDWKQGYASVMWISGLDNYLIVAYLQFFDAERNDSTA